MHSHTATPHPPSCTVTITHTTPPNTHTPLTPTFTLALYPRPFSFGRIALFCLLVAGTGSPGAISGSGSNGRRASGGGLVGMATGAGPRRTSLGGLKPAPMERLKAKEYWDRVRHTHHKQGQGQSNGTAVLLGGQGGLRSALYFSLAPARLTPRILWCGVRV